MLQKLTRITPSASLSTVAITFPADRTVLNFFFFPQLGCMPFHWLPFWLMFKNWTQVLSPVTIFPRNFSPSELKYCCFSCLYSHLLTFLELNRHSLFVVAQWSLQMISNCWMLDGVTAVASGVSPSASLLLQIHHETVLTSIVASSYNFSVFCEQFFSVLWMWMVISSFAWKNSITWSYYYVLWYQSFCNWMLCCPMLT